MGTDLEVVEPSEPCFTEPPGSGEPMRPLSAVDLLSVWEQGCDLHGVDQALLVSRYSCPEYLYRH